MSDQEKTTVRNLRRAKSTLRARRRQLSLPEKVAQVVALQRAVLPAIQSRRPLHPWERVWDIAEAEDPPHRD